MVERFVQKRIAFNDETSVGKLRVSTLVGLLDGHPYKDLVIKAFALEEDIMNEVIVIDHIDVVYKRVKLLNEHFERYSVLAYSKDISIAQNAKSVKDVRDEKPLIFNFSEYVEIDEVKEDLECFAIYDSKNTFFDEFDMAKYANRLHKDNIWQLADYNIQYFRKLAETEKRFNKYRSFRLVKNKEQLFLRGITSVDKYFEYGVDFTFVTSMLLLHKDMKINKGNNYSISSTAISESKLELIISEKTLKDGGEFGKVSSAMVVSTNDLGQGSLNFTKIIKVGGELYNGVYLFPESQQSTHNKLIISHSTGPNKALIKLNEVTVLLNDTDEFIKDLHDVKSIKTPDELRMRIFSRLSSPQSVFKNELTLKDIFKTPIENEIKSFSKLLEMCNKAEELDIDYDLKDKLRYIISEIILSTKK